MTSKQATKKITQQVEAGDQRGAYETFARYVYEESKTVRGADTRFGLLWKAGVRLAGVTVSLV